MNLKKILKNLFQIDGIYRCKIGDDFYRADHVLKFRLIKCSPNEGSSGKGINKDAIIFYVERFILTLLEDTNDDLIELVSKTLTIYEDDVPVFERKIGDILLRFNLCRNIIENTYFPYVSSLAVPGKVYAFSSEEYSKSDFEKFRENCTIVGYHHYKWLVKIASNEDFLMTKMAFSDYFKDHIIAKELNLYQSLIDLIMAKLEDHGNDVNNFRDYLRKQYLTF